MLLNTPVRVARVGQNVVKYVAVPNPRHAVAGSFSLLQVKTMDGAISRFIRARRDAERVNNLSSPRTGDIGGHRKIPILGYPLKPCERLRVLFQQLGAVGFRGPPLCQRAVKKAYCGDVRRQTLGQIG